MHSPFLRSDIVPSHETETHALISSNLNRINQLAEEFRDSWYLQNEAELRLAEVLQDERDMSISTFPFDPLKVEHLRDLRRRSINWQFIAIRNASIVVKSFSSVMGLTTGLVRNFEPYKDQIDFTLTKKATSKLAKAFPHLQQHRDAMAHPGELFASPEGIEKNGLSGDKMSIPVGSTSIATKNGKLHHFDLSRESVSALLDVRATYFSAYKLVDISRPDFD